MTFLRRFSQRFESKTSFSFAKPDILPKIERYPDIVTAKNFANKTLLLSIGFKNRANLLIIAKAPISML
jgi:hypothetical protein